MRFSFVIVLLLLLGQASDSSAQPAAGGAAVKSDPSKVGAGRSNAANGADHYEVTIAPPSRPGSAPAAALEGEPSVAEPTPSLKDDPLPEAAADAEDAAHVKGPLHSLQVGAYRQRRSAEEMSEKLGASFGEVQVVEIDSGGEKLYRVRVGKLPSGAALNDLKRRLLAAGYPAFEVALPETVH